MSSPSDQTILITGASGFVASHILRAFLNAGYNVRGTLRSSSAIASVTAAQGALASRLSFAIVPHVNEPGALREALKGVSGVIHTASPFNLNPVNNEEDLLKPAVSMTTNVLSEAASSPTVKRVVITSSFAAILDIPAGNRPGYIYTEKVWSPATYAEAAASTNGAFTYCTSKKLAEEAAWQWMEQHKPAFTLSTICPPWVFGPSINPIKSLEQLNESTEAIYKLINGSATEVPGIDFAGFADARDVAEAHLQAYEREAAGGERFLVGGHFDYQSAVDAIRSAFPELKNRVPEGKPGVLEDVYIPDGSKAERMLGIRYTSLADSMRDTVADLLEAEKRLAA
jgi:NADPH-dependent methylglyoxal reductase